MNIGITNSLEIIYVVLVMTQKHKSFLGHNGLKFMFHSYNTHKPPFFFWFYFIYFLKATCFYTFILQHFRQTFMGFCLCFRWNLYNLKFSKNKSLFMFKLSLKVKKPKLFFIITNGH